MAFRAGVIGVLAAIGLMWSSEGFAARPLETAVLIPALSGAEATASYARIRAAGATKVRLVLSWRAVAPDRRPAGFDAADPRERRYRWAAFDRSVRQAVAAGLEPIISIVFAPGWATGRGEGPLGTVRPSPSEFARFASAAARRYSGRVPGLPKVRFWQAWNEPNLRLYLSPQFVRKRPVGATWYRWMLNAFAGAIHDVDPENVVIAGGLAPFTDRADVGSEFGYGPLAFMRDLFCLSRRLRPTCDARSAFDVWAHNPYTSGDPKHRATRRDDVSLGDLPEMQAVLRAATRHGHVIAQRPVRFWVTEFSWDTSPPDPKAVPLALHARWTAEALYRMWAAGVTLVTWFHIRDEPMNRSHFQSGLHFRSWRPKPALQAFRFPFVALPQRGRILVWGRTPTSRAGPVVVERRSGGGWRRVAMLRADRYGIFTRRLAAPRVGPLRARFAGDVALPFSLKRPPDRFVFPFGTP